MPTLDDESPDAKQRDREGERRRAADEVREARVRALDRVDVRVAGRAVEELRRDASIAMFTSPARPSATITSVRAKRSTRVRSASSRTGVRPFVSAEWR